MASQKPSYMDRLLSTTNSLSKNLAIASDNEVALPISILDKMRLQLTEQQSTERSVAKLGTLFRKVIYEMGKDMGKDLENPKSRRFATEATKKDPKYFRELQEIYAWSRMETECKWRSPTTHLQELRQPHKYVAWYTNRSDTFDRFLYRSAMLKIKATIQKWREVYFQKECHKDNEMNITTEDDKVKHLQQQLDALMEHVDCWREGPDKTKLVEQIMRLIFEEMEWRADQKVLAENWEKDFEILEQLVDTEMDDYGLRLDDLPELEEALIKAEKQEAARIEEQERIGAEEREAAAIEEQERLERENAAAAEEQEEDEEEDDDSDDDFSHLYADIPTPPLRPTDSMSVCEQELAISRPISLYQLENGPLTPPRTPPNECATPEPATKDHFIPELINALTEERELWAWMKGDSFQPDYLDPPVDDSQYHGCAWKLHPVSYFLKDLLPPSNRSCPDLRLTDPGGNVFTLEQRLPELGQDFKQELLERQSWCMAIEELLRRDCDFEQISQWSAVQNLRKSGWEPKNDTDSDNSDDDEEDDRSKRPISRQEHHQEVDIVDTVSPTAAFTDSELEEVFDQEISYLEPGQEFDISISTSNPPKKNNNVDAEMALINALLDDTYKRREFYQEIWESNLHIARRLARPPACQLSENGHCSWKQHPLSEPTSPSTQLVPELVVTDPEGNIYTLEECVATLDEYSAWQSEKEIELDEMGETTEADSKMNLEKARADIEYFDDCFKKCLWLVKNDYIERWRTLLKRDEEARKLVDKKKKGKQKV